MQQWLRQARTLLEKADEDLHAAEALLNAEKVSDELWGFHAQQAVEKLLKGLLSYRRVAFPFTHNLSELIELTKNAGRSLPDELGTLSDLTPYAAELRYGFLDPQKSRSLDRNAILTRIKALRAFVHSNLDPADSGAG